MKKRSINPIVNNLFHFGFPYKSEFHTKSSSLLEQPGPMGLKNKKRMRKYVEFYSRTFDFREPFKVGATQVVSLFVFIGF